MKKINVSPNVSEMSKDFNALCKKYKLKKAVLVAELGESIVLDVHSTNKKNEEALMNPLRDLLFTTGLNVNALTIVGNFAKEEEKRQELYARENKLSKADKMKLLLIRSEKNEYVHNKQYEKASKARDKELKLLGYPTEKKPTAKLNMEDLTDYKPSVKELEKLTADLISATKGWTLTEPGK